MSKFTPTVSREFEVDGDKVQVRFRRLTREQFGKLSPFDGVKEQTKIMEMLEVVAPILKENVKEMTGLTDSEGNVVTLDMALAEAYFLGFMSDLVGAVVEESVLNEKKPES